MRDGRRLYLEYTAERTGEHMIEDLSIAPLSARETPAPECCANVSWHRATHINKYLGLTGRAIPD
jgi:hypothetical protein